MPRSLNLTVTSPIQTFEEPVTLSELKKELNLPERSPLDGDEDELLSRLIGTARHEKEIQLDVDLVPRQWDYSLDWFDEHVICLKDKLISVDLVRYRDSSGNYRTLIENTDYIVVTTSRPGFIEPVYGRSWPSFTPWSSEGSVLVRFTSGLAADDIFWSDASGKNAKSAILRMAAELFNGNEKESFTARALMNTGSIPRVR